MQEHRSFELYEMMTRLGIEPNGSVLPRLSLRYAKSTAANRVYAKRHAETGLTTRQC
jgi:hypothetical protein